MPDQMRQFYETAYSGTDYSAPLQATDHAFYRVLSQFLDRVHHRDARCLEVGSGRGAFQQLVPDYTGVDLSVTAGQTYQRPFTAASAVRLPFAEHTFDIIWTITVLEHIPDPEQALLEIWRVLKPGGYLFLAPAWQCRSWAAQGYPVRPYADFDWRGKLIKASIPLRDSLLFRSLRIFPLRLWRMLWYIIQRQPTVFHYSVLEPNYEQYWMSDGDAVNSMDPFEAYLWFRSRGAYCLNYPRWSQGFLIRTGAICFQKPLQSESS